MIPIDFDTKFEVQREPASSGDTMRAIILTKENFTGICKLTADPAILSKWSKHFHSIMNHFGFHDNFKVFKKIGKGSFASVYLAERNSDKQ